MLCRHSFTTGLEKSYRLARGQASKSARNARPLTGPAASADLCLAGKRTDEPWILAVFVGWLVARFAS